MLPPPTPPSRCGGRRGRLVKDKGLRVELICLGQRCGQVAVRTKHRLVFREKFKDLWAGRELGIFQVPCLEGRRLWLPWIPNLRFLLLTHLQTPKLVKNTPKLGTVVPQSELECSFSSHQLTLHRTRCAKKPNTPPPPHTERTIQFWQKPQGLPTL